MATEQNIDIFAQLQVLTWELDVNRLVLTINNQQKSETHELLAWQQTIHRLDRDQVINMLLDTISERRSMFDCQLKLQSADAQWKTFRMRGVPVRSQGAAKVSFVKGILEDFSQYDLQLMELQKKVSRQDMLAKEKNDFFASITHELRTPMSGVIGLADLLLESGTLDQDNLSLAQSIRQCGSSLLTLVNDTLDLAKLEARKLSLVPVQFEIRKLVSDIEALFSGKFAQKEHTFVAIVNEDVPRFITTDPNRLQQVLVNLIGNAQKFTPLGGGICLRVELLNAFEGSASLLLSVIDSGIGIKAENQKSIFDEYTQETELTAQKFGGTGLGLSIARELVDLFGGSLKVRSEPGRGTVFQFNIQVPVPRSELDCPIVSNEIEVLEPHKKLKILLAEDNLVNQKVASRMLEKMGHEVVIAQNGKCAVEIYQRSSFDLILMDIQMPIMSGDQATKMIRDGEKEKEAKPIPIIALTAHAMTGDREKYLAMGMNNYVTKPIDKNVLLRAIADIVVR